MAVGISGLFVETHPNPDCAPSDGPNMWPLHLMEELLITLKEIDAVAKKRSLMSHETKPSAIPVS